MGRCGRFSTYTAAGPAWLSSRAHVVHQGAAGERDGMRGCGVRCAHQRRIGAGWRGSQTARAPVPW